MPQTSKKVRSLLRLQLHDLDIFCIYIYVYNDIFDQFRSYRYLLYAYSTCVYSPYTVIPYIKGVKNPTGQLVEMEHRDNEYQGYDYQEVKDTWVQTRKWFEQSAVAQFPSQLVLSSHFLQFDYAGATSWEWIRLQEKSVAQLWHTKQGVYRRKERADVRDGPMRVQQ